LSLDEAQISQSGTTIVNGNLCIVIADSLLFTVPNSYLPRDDNPDCASMSIFRFEGNFRYFAHPHRTNDVSFLAILTANSPYGVSAMSVNVVLSLTEPIRDALDITFWIRPESTTGEKDGQLLVPLKSKSMPGFFFSTLEESRWESLVQTLSGKRGLVLLNMRDGGAGDCRQVLRLVSCDHQMTQATYRDLVLPDFINLFNVRGLFLDDHLGVVSMIDPTGVLYTIPYA
jgi:hypothetical protein